MTENSLLNKLDGLVSRFEEVGTLITDPAVIADMKRFVKLNKEYHVVIFDGARIGNNCNIFPGAVIAGIPQDLKFKGERTTAEIGDNTTIRECTTVNRGTASKGKTVIGENCLIMK